MTYNSMKFEISEILYIIEREIICVLHIISEDLYQYDLCATKKCVIVVNVLSSNSNWLGYGQ